MLKHVESSDSAEVGAKTLTSGVLTPIYKLPCNATPAVLRVYEEHRQDWYLFLVQEYYPRGKLFLSVSFTRHTHMRSCHLLPTRLKKAMEQCSGKFARFALYRHHQLTSFTEIVSLRPAAAVAAAFHHARTDCKAHLPSGHQSACTERWDSVAYGFSVKVFQFAAPTTLLPISVSTTLNHRLVGSFLHVRSCRSRSSMKPAGDSSYRKSRKKVFRGVQ